MQSISLGKNNNGIKSMQFLDQSPLYIFRLVDNIILFNGKVPVSKRINNLDTTHICNDPKYYLASFLLIKPSQGQV